MIGNAVDDHNFREVLPFGGVALWGVPEEGSFELAMMKPEMW